MLEGDPEVRPNGVGRSHFLPIADDRVLNPFEVHAVIDVPHVVDVVGGDPDGIAEHLELHAASLIAADIDVNNCTK
jgi:hypothetical protein